MTIRYRSHPDLRLTALQGEGVVLHLGSRRYFTVSESGLVILQALNVSRTFEELVAALTERYEVSPEQAEQSVREFLDRCRQGGLLVEEETPA
jgi:hypothetical protein